MAADLAPQRFEAKGKSYRFVNDREVTLGRGSASVRVRNETNCVSIPDRVFTVDGYASFSMQMMLVRSNIRSVRFVVTMGESTMRPSSGRAFVSPPRIYQSVFTG